MTTARHRGQWLHQRLGGAGTSLLMLPLVGWVWLAASEPVRSVVSGAVPSYLLSGRIFSEPFNIVHAGFVLDQPTIGKWLFWFSVMAASSLPCAAAVGWLSDRRGKGGRIAFGIGTGVLCGFLLCILSWPLVWLIQYVGSLGCTPKRTFGLVYAGIAGCVVLGFLAWAIRKPRASDAEAGPLEDGPATSLAGLGGRGGRPQ
jgi:hypothetical protein